MTAVKPLVRNSKVSRIAALAIAAGLMAALGGCVVYPAYYGPPHYHYWR